MTSRPKPSTLHSHNPRHRLHFIFRIKLPLIGPLFVRWVINYLIRLASRGDRRAAFSLGSEYDTLSTLSQDYVSFIETVKDPFILNSIWSAWFEKRSQKLLEFLKSKQIPATEDEYVRLFSLLALARKDQLKRIRVSEIPILIIALNDIDEDIKSNAVITLSQLKSQPAITSLCQKWLKNRSTLLAEIIQESKYLPEKPDDVRMMVALKFNFPEVVIHTSSDGVQTLITACQDPDPAIRDMARKCLPNLQNQSAIDELCKIWANTRSSFLAEIIQQSQFLAEKPFELRLLVSLKLKRLEVARSIPPGHLSELTNHLHDDDPDISQSALTALSNLTNPNTIDALCEAGIEDDDSIARRISLSSGYLPSSPEKRALFLFITRQWQAYEAIDFDLRLLQTIYQFSSSRLKDKIAGLIQETGNSKYLSILTGIDLSINTHALSEGSIDVLIRVLTANKDWARLNDLAFVLDPFRAIEVFRSIENSGWLPTQPADRFELQAIFNLSGRTMPEKSMKWQNAVPMAIPCSHLRLSSRINALAFSPDGFTLAIGTGTGRVVLWNLQKGEIIKVLRRFNHAISSLIFTSDNVLVIAERSSKNVPCGMFTYQEDDTLFLGQHNGSVIGLCLISDHQFLSIGKDYRMILWDARTRLPVSEGTITFWPRGWCNYQAQDKVLLLSNQIVPIAIPTMQTETPIIPRRRKGIGHSSLLSLELSSTGNTIWMGQYNGQLLNGTLQDGQKTVLLNLVDSLNSRTISVLRGWNKTVLAASAKGKINQYDEDSGLYKNSLQLTKDQLTSIQISSNKSFMATGSSESEITLWDLRIEELSRILEQPFSLSTTDDLAIVNAAIQSTSLPGPVVNLCKFCQIALQHRFQYDIQIQDYSSLKSGEFDIVVDNS